MKTRNRRPGENGPTTWDVLPLYLTADEVSPIIRRGRSSTYELMRRKEIPSCKLGGQMVVPRDALRQHMERLLSGDPVSK